MPEPSLTTLQRWMSLLIKHPTTCDDAAREDDARALIPRGRVVAGEIVKPSPTQDPLQRLDIYNGSYLSRLIEVLESDFDALKYALGDDGWFELAKGYVYHHPSRHTNLNFFGDQMAGFVAAQTGLEHGAFLTELATLQWAVAQSFGAPEFEPFDMSALASLTQEQWPGVVMTGNPSVRLLACRYPTNRYLQAFWDGNEPEIPDTEGSWVCVNRKQHRVWRTGLPEPIFAILDALLRGVPFGAALETGGEHEENVQSWFQEWSADGVFAAVDAPA